jgi:GTP-binding protein
VVVSAQAREGLGWLHTAKFLTSASKISQLPQGDMPEIAFVGRSNAGKSSAINTLAQQRQLAFASKTPGRTQLINLFTLGPREAPDAFFADLPGYGYAAVARGKKLVWQKVMADYLEVRRALMGVVLLIDSRHGFTPLDLQLMAFIAQRVKTGEIKLLVLLTKADKLGKQEQTLAIQAASAVLADFTTDDSDIAVTLFSSMRRVGVEDVAEQMIAWKHAMPERVHFEVPPMPQGEAGEPVEDAGVEEDDAA